MTRLTLKEHQKEFAKAQEKYVGLFGGIGNGKTLSGCLKAIDHLTNNPGDLFLIGRLTYQS